MVEKRTSTRLTQDQLQWLNQFYISIDTPEKIYRLKKLVENEEDILELLESKEVIIDMANKEKSWRWFKKGARDMATLFLAISAAMYGAYEIWVKFVSSTIKKATGND
jgi:hypothetical protein